MMSPMCLPDNQRRPWPQLPLVEGLHRGMAVETVNLKEERDERRFERLLAGAAEGGR